MEVVVPVPGTLWQLPRVVCDGLGAVGREKSSITGWVSGTTLETTEAHSWGDRGMAPENPGRGRTELGNRSRWAAGEGIVTVTVNGAQARGDGKAGVTREKA